jgi:hypothetical protein
MQYWEIREDSMHRVFFPMCKEAEEELFSGLEKTNRASIAAFHNTTFEEASNLAQNE